MEKTSLYVHIPFCKHKCNYCDFYSINYDGKLADEYIDVLFAQIKDCQNKYVFDTVYFGGGTPSILNNNQLEKILSAVDIKKDTECTIEINPESITLDKLKLMKNNGVNRLSIGVQSFDDKILSFLGRYHDAKKAYSVISDAVNCGIENITIDLIYAVPGQTLSMWKKELKKSVKLPIKHLSLYALTYEKGTRLKESLNRKEFRPISDNIDAQMYCFSQSFLETKDIHQYEVSNFAYSDYNSRHNSAYWRNNGYVGLGAGAVEYLNGVRRKHCASVEKYVDGYRKGSESFEDVERLSPQQHAFETAMLNLRSVQGIDFISFFEKTGYDIQKLRGSQIEQLVRDELLEYCDSQKRVRPTQKGFRFYDHIAKEIL